MDLWGALRWLGRERLAALAFATSLGVLVGLCAWLGPDLLAASFVPILLLSGLAGYGSWRWSRHHL